MLEQQAKIILLEGRKALGKSDREEGSLGKRAESFEDIMKKNREAQEKLRKDRQVNNLSVLKSYKIIK